MDVEFLTGILDKCDMWEVDDFDMMQSISSHAYDNECRPRECSEAFTTNKVKVIDM